MKCMFVKKIRSFTLIELLITITLSSLIILSCLSVFYTAYFTNINQRKNYGNLLDINYAINYMENEISNAVKIKINSNGIILWKYTYNSYLFEKRDNYVSEFNKIEYKIKKNKEGYDIDRISKDILNKTDYGVNKIIKNVESVDFEFSGNCLNLKFSTKGKVIEKCIYMDKLDKFNYLFGEKDES